MPGGNFLARYFSRPQQEAYIMNGGVHHAPGSTGAMSSEYRASSGTVTTTMSMDEHDGDPAQAKFLPSSDRPSRGRACLRSWSTKEKILLALCLVLSSVCIITIAVITSHQSHQQNESSNVCLTQECVTTAAHLMSGMDFSAEPCHDFYQYACGAWNRKHVIPNDMASFTTFDQHHEELQQVMRVLLEKPQQPNDPAANNKIKMLYRSCMNTSSAVEANGNQPLKDVAASLGGWPIQDPSWNPDTFVLEDVLATIRGRYNQAFIYTSKVSADDKNSSINIIQFKEISLGMPSREYYLLDEHKDDRAAYKAFLTDLVRLMGGKGPGVDNQTRDILDFETELTKVMMPTEEGASSGVRYMKMTVKEFQSYIPEFDVLRYLRGFIPGHITDQEPVVVFALDYVRAANEIIKKTSKRTLSNYLIWRLLAVLAPHSSEPFREAYSKYIQVMKGVTERPIRWMACVEQANKHMGMAMGAMFIADHFKKNSLETTMEMIRFLRQAFIELLDENEWMDQKTKEFARDKAVAIAEHIGYPAFIADPVQLDAMYQVLQFRHGDFFHNYLQLKEFHAKKMMKKLREPIRKDIWDQLVVTVNAFYNPNTNTIVFPAGILQPIFYSETYPKSLNFGGIGVVIGHEITHGFDDKGRQYDKYGNIKQWWDNHTIEAFHHQTQCIIDQYSSLKYEQINRTVNGKKTQGENIADNGGLKQSFRAYRKWVAIHGEEQPLPGLGLTHNQLFFLNYARIWCGNTRDEEALKKFRTSVHSPLPIRLLGTLSNSKDFSQAFNCPLGSRMNPKNKCSVW